MQEKSEISRGRRQSVSKPLLVADREVSLMLAISRGMVWKLVELGQLTPVRIGTRCTRFRMEEVSALAERGVGA